jgi:hypothetical protein
MTWRSSTDQGVETRLEGCGAWVCLVSTPIASRVARTQHPDGAVRRRSVRSARMPGGRSGTKTLVCVCVTEHSSPHTPRVHACMHACSLTYCLQTERNRGSSILATHGMHEDWPRTVLQLLHCPHLDTSRHSLTGRLPESAARMLAGARLTQHRQPQNARRATAAYGSCHRNKLGHSGARVGHASWPARVGTHPHQGQPTSDARADTLQTHWWLRGAANTKGGAPFSAGRGTCASAAARESKLLQHGRAVCSPTARCCRVCRE